MSVRLKDDRLLQTSYKGGLYSFLQEGARAETYRFARITWAEGECERNRFKDDRLLQTSDKGGLHSFLQEGACAETFRFDGITWAEGSIGTPESSPKKTDQSRVKNAFDKRKFFRERKNIS